MQLKKVSDIYASPGYLLRCGGQLVTATFDATLGDTGITVGQMTALLAIYMQPGLQQRELATLLSWDEATVGGMIKRLETSGHVRRESSTRSSRGRQIYMTSEGEVFYKKIRPSILRIQKKLLRNLSVEEAQQLLYLLSKLMDIDNSHHTPSKKNGAK